MNYLKWKENGFAPLQAIVNIIITRNSAQRHACARAHTWPD